jgi:hypothetical protein
VTCRAEGCDREASVVVNVAERAGDKRRVVTVVCAFCWQHLRQLEEACRWVGLEVWFGSPPASERDA